jgi:hypothetical protein
MTKRPAVSNPAVKRAQGIKTVSDEELRKMVSRMQLEKQYKDLTPSDTNMGRQYVTGILKDSGRTALTAAGSAIMLYAIKKAIQASGKVPQSELGDLTLFPKKK